jgi:toxin-antitoxin system PIN domain toxin
MILPDASILVHACNTGSLHHKAARAWWEETLTQPRPVGLPWVSILGFVRIMTRRGVLQIPMYPNEAIQRVQSWLAVQGVQILSPGEFHGEIFFRLIEHAGTAGDLTTLAHLAALAIEYHAELVSTDTDFARFPGLRWFNPVGL